MSPFAPTYHHNLISQLVDALAGLRKEGWIARGEVPVRCRALNPSQSKDLAPDVAVLKLSDYRQRLPIFTSHMVVMAVEVLSPGNSRASMLEKTQFI